MSDSTGENVVSFTEALAERSTGTLSDVAQDVLAYRAHQTWPAQPADTSPVTLEEIAEAALRRLEDWKRAAWESFKATRPGNARYSAPDSTRPWDVSDRGGETVTDHTRHCVERAMLMLLAGRPGQAAESLRFTAGLIEKAVDRHRECEARAARAEREKRRREIERERIEKEERRIARERERARRRIAAS